MKGLEKEIKEIFEKFAKVMDREHLAKFGFNRFPFKKCIEWQEVKSEISQKIKELENTIEKFALDIKGTEKWYHDEVNKNQELKKEIERWKFDSNETGYILKDTEKEVDGLKSQLKEQRKKIDTFSKIFIKTLDKRAFDREEICRKEFVNATEEGIKLQSAEIREIKILFEKQLKSLLENEKDEK
jgi:virulence-associated protein VapD